MGAILATVVLSTLFWLRVRCYFTNSECIYADRLIGQRWTFWQRTPWEKQQTQQAQMATCRSSTLAAQLPSPSSGGHIFRY